MKNILREQLTFLLARQYLDLNHEVKILGPLRYERSKDRLWIERAIEFRRKQNNIRARHLEDINQQMIENMLLLDKRSLHFIAIKDGSIVASVRLTGAPFEMSLLNPNLRRYQGEKFHGYFEYGRLCTDVNLKNKGEVAKFLLIKAGLWAMSSSSARGLIAICKEEKVNFMQKFGLCPLERKLIINGREGDYVLIGATREEIIEFFISHFTRPLLQFGAGLGNVVRWRFK